MIITTKLTREDSEAMQHAHNEWDVQQDNTGQVIIYTGIWEVEREGDRHYVYEKDLTDKEREHFGLYFDGDFG